MSEEVEDAYLPLASIQHYVVCPRQWALMYVERQWADNYWTVDGEIFHEAAHNSDFTEKRSDLIVTRGMRVKSHKLEITGVCDIVEFHECEDGVPIKGRKGNWLPIPIEYKRGRPKLHEADKFQLCAQAICLEEMLACNIACGYIYYGEPRRREEVDFSQEMRDKVTACYEEMNKLYKRGYTPKVRKRDACRLCSLANICLPELNGNTSVTRYIAERLGK